MSFGDGQAGAFARSKLCVRVFLYIRTVCFVTFALSYYIKKVCRWVQFFNIENPKLKYNYITINILLDVSIVIIRIIIIFYYVRNITHRY